MTADPPRVASGTSRALVRACHPEPTVAVTAFAATLAAVARTPLTTWFAVIVAVLAGQLVIGWSNDLIDASRDRIAGRADKPMATGSLTAAVLGRALLGAVLVVLVASALLGWRAGLANLWIVGWGVAYNAGLKATALSWLPYAAAFGALPAVATLALPAARLPGLWVVAAGALLGVAANLTNALPDLVDDERTGVRGLPHRLGARWSLRTAAVLLVVVTVLVVFGPPGDPRPVGWIGLVVVLGIVAGWLRQALGAPASRTAFVGIMVITGIDLVLLVLSRSGLR